MIENKITTNFRPLSPGQIYDLILKERLNHRAKINALTARQLARPQAKLQRSLP
jgi:hypothetical protein